MLPQDVSISIEEQNPLFSDSGSFSYPIEMSVSQNRELFKSIDSPHGRIRPQDLDGLPFELWYDGVMLLYGSTETDEDLDIEEDKCSINLVSGNGDFQSKIDGMQCTDVPLMSKVLIGRVSTELGFSIYEKSYECMVNTDHTMSFSYPNVSEPYSPSHPYCNVRICVKRTDDYDPKEEVPYWVYEADRSWSGVCFYVAYFLDCLFYHLGIRIKENNLSKVEDMTRLAFFNTKCEHELGEEITDEDEIPTKDYADYTVTIKEVSSENLKDVWVRNRKVYASEKNFPETDVSTVIKSLFNAFGLKVVYDTAANEASLFYIRDILRDNSIENVFLTVKSNHVSHQKIDGVKLSYGGDEDNTSFNYSEWSEVVVTEDYKSILSKISPHNRNCYINKDTGNKYRIKVEKEAYESNDIKRLYPSLVEVSQFPSYIQGKEGDKMEELDISFVPVIENDVTLDSLKENSLLNLSSQRLGVLVDAEMKERSKRKERLPFIFDGSEEEKTAPYILVEYKDPQNYDEASNKRNPLLTLDSGFTLGIMRGPGNESAVQVYLDDYDGNGNDAWTTVVADYAFTADTMDAYGNRYDYNGTEEGGIANQENSISLKTHIQTAKDVGLDTDWGIDSTAAKRGLADRFMSEYMYFLLHRKTVTMEVDTTLSHLTSLSWFKQLRINDTVGRLKSRSYTLTNSGVTDMSIELYTIN